MKAPDESGINKEFPEKSTEWNVTTGKRCTDASSSRPQLVSLAVEEVDSIKQ